MDGRGLPLLSGPPPLNSSETAEMGCRKCAKEFNILFTRSRRCNHCGYAYCHSCTDYQALMPRDSSTGQSGYDPMNVCAFCIEFLQITAAGKGALKTLPLAKLRKYAGAYNIRIDHAVEKDDVIEALLAARQPNGCLTPYNESYYRRYSVPNRAGPGPSSTRARVQNLFSTSTSRNTSSSNSVPPPPPPPQHTRPEFARPDLEPDDRGIPIRPRLQPYSAASRAPPPRNTATRPQSTPVASPYQPVPTPTPTSRPYPNYVPPPHPSYASYPHSYPNAQNSNALPRAQQYHPYSPHTSNSSASRSSHNLHVPPSHVPPRPGSVPPRRASSAAPSTQTPTFAPQPTPTLDELLTMTSESLSTMSISTLKAILFANHVNSGMILEKGDLVRRVIGLVEDERKERREHEERELEEQRHREEIERIEREKEEKEDQERIRIQHEMMEAFERERQEREEREQERDRQREADTRRREEERLEDLERDQMQVDGDSDNASHNNTSPPPTPPKTSSPVPLKAPAKAPATAAFVERTGLCVVCQDEEANIAIVDCGHLAMCRTCCDSIMQSTRECPLCRTRIVTEARLLRIFKA
ncbi:hypothetical protein J3R30DRAFT_3430189 [Lentinula aciculospora]|uniref:RING-type domain-containing protein n=1 Tax=Lentinula aciculospora TaxID=153920 RepID=A0A9W9DVW6_9AGAR|nr:hypothetical protein J3R30DRAFT_3430189 [Lentinula aciculospora]